MPTIQEIRQKYPQYSDMTDEALAGALHKKYYSDMDVNTFNQKIGLTVTPREQTQSPAQQLLTDFQNQLTAAEQRTTPIQGPTGHAPNFLSDKIWEDDSGRAGFTDAQGNSILADSSKHVILKDPADGKLKAYARTENTNESGLSSLARVAAMGMGATQALPATAAAKAVTPSITASEQAIEAAQRIGVPLNRAAASSSKIVNRAGQTLENIPVVGAPLQKSNKSMWDALEEAKQRTFADAGGLSPEIAGTRFRDSAEGYIENLFEPRVDSKYKAVDAFIDPNIRAPLAEGQKAASQIQARYANTGMKGEAPPVRAFGEAINSPTGTNYQGAKDLRSMVGRAASSKTQDFAKGELDQIYGGLTQDIYGIAAQSGGDQAVTALKRADKFYSLSADRKEQILKIIGDKAPKSGEGIADYLFKLGGSSSKADVNKLAMARKVAGDSWKEISSSFIGKVVESPQFVSQYEKLPEKSKSILFGASKQALDDIYTVSKRLQEYSKSGNSSGTLNNAIAVGAPLGFFSQFVTRPISATASALSTGGIGIFLSRPATARGTSKLLKAYESYAKTPNKGTYRQLTFMANKLAQAANQNGFGFNAEAFIRAAQGQSPAAAGENN